MNYRPLGRIGMQVSELCMGTMAFGSDADAVEASLKRLGTDRSDEAAKA